jgi:hypothetical protein
MRCDDVRTHLDELWGAELPPEVNSHLGDCSVCAACYRDLLLLREGLELWKSDDAPAPSVGFAARVVRSLRDDVKAPAVADFFELVGRRFVAATFALVLLAVLAFTLPTYGPVKSLSAADIQERGQEATLAYSDPMGPTLPQETPQAAPANGATQAVPHEGK